MPTLTIKGLPDPLYRRLKERAATEHRSLNQQIITCLEAAVARPPETIEARLAEIDAIRERISRSLPPLTDDFLRRAKDAGRP